MKKLSILAVVFAFLATTSLSFAAQNAEINVTSEPVPAGSACAKAGGFTIGFDTGTVLTEGDILTFDLDLGTTLCNDIDLILGEAIDAPAAGATAFGTSVGPILAANFPYVAGSAIVSSDGGGTLVLGGANTDGDTGLYIRVTGTAGTARVTLSVIGDAGGPNNDATLTFTEGSAGATLLLKFLDGASYTAAPAATEGAVYAVTDATTAPITCQRATVAQNSLCINVSGTTAAKINANFDSAGDIFSYDPSNPQVAHIVSSESYLLYENKSRVTGGILYPSTTQTGCSPIDNESPTTIGTGFCTTGTVHTSNELIVQAPGAFSIDGEIEVVLEILVNGLTGANGVYWGGTGIDVSADSDAATVITAGAAVNAVAVATTLELANGTAATIDAVQTDCTVADADKGVTLTSAATATTALGLATGANGFMYINMPVLTYDSTEVSEGDTVAIRVTINSLPCGQIINAQTWEIGTFGCETAVTVRSQRYPYFSKEGAYTNAIIITNVEANDGTADLTLYEDDGDIFTATVSVNANSLYVDLLGNIAWTANAASTGSGVQGDARAYMELSSTFNCDGAAMITNPTDGQSMGYLPRQ